MHPWQMTTVWACENTVVMVKQPGHLTSMKKDRGLGTRVYPRLLVSSPKDIPVVLGFVASYLELVLLGFGSRAGVEQINGENLVKIFVSIAVPCRQCKFKPSTIGSHHPDGSISLMILGVACRAE